MNRTSTAIITIFAFVGAAVAWWLLNSDVTRTTYGTMEEVRAARAIDRGWVPGALPPSSFEIKEEHNLDTNAGAGSFRFSPEDASALRGRLEHKATTLSVFVEKQRMEGFEVYESVAFVIAVNWARSEGRFWLAESVAPNKSLKSDASR